MNSIGVKSIQSVTNKVLTSLKPGSNKRTYIFGGISVGIGFILFLLAWRLAPWFYAVDARVRLYLDAPAETKIVICWDKKNAECLPLVPYLKTQNRIALPGEVAEIWMSELPPRPTYFISLIFKSGIKDAVFHNLELDSSNMLLYGRIQSAGISNIRLNIDQFDLNKTSYTLMDHTPYLNSNVGGQLKLNRELVPGPLGDFKNEMTTIKIWALLYSIYLLIILPIFLLPQIISNLSSAIKTANVPKYSWWIYLLFGSAFIITPLLVLNSGVSFNEYDPLSYLSLAIGKVWFNETRLPGYPLFLNFALWLSSYNLDGVILLQAIALVSSVIICVFVLRKWIPQTLAALFVLLCLFSPAQIYWARWILRESLFASLMLLGLTAIIAHFTNPQPFSKVWLCIFAITCGAAFLVRENGIILPVAMIPVLILEIIKLLLSSQSFRERMRLVSRLIVHYSAPVVIVGVIYIVFAGYNYLHYGYFQIGVHQTSHSYLVKAIYPGNSDSRGLLYSKYSADEAAKPYLGYSLYSSFIFARDQTPGLDPIYMSLYQFVNLKLSEQGAVNPFYRANILNEIGRGMNNLVTRKASLAGILRQYNDLISLQSATLYPLQTGNPYATATNQELLGRLPIKVKFTEKIINPDSILANYYAVMQEYKWFSLIFILALFSAIYILMYDNPAFLAPMAVFIANGALLIFTRLLDNRYLVSLDVLLILQMILGLSSLARKTVMLNRLLVGSGE